MQRPALSRGEVLGRRGKTKTTKQKGIPKHDYLEAYPFTVAALSRGGVLGIRAKQKPKCDTTVKIRKLKPWQAPPPLGKQSWLTKTKFHIFSPTLPEIGDMILTHTPA